MFMLTVGFMYYSDITTSSSLPVQSYSCEAKRRYVNTGSLKKRFVSNLVLLAWLIHFSENARQKVNRLQQVVRRMVLHTVIFWFSGRFSL
jgi:hypothetical protein